MSPGYSDDGDAPSAGGPLDDLVVLDFTVARAGPTAVRYLADWGARVLRVEPAGEGSTLGAHTSSDYINLHRSKELVRLDLRSEADRRAIRGLVGQVDVVVENFRAPVKRKLGIDYEALSALNPRLIYGSISGYGEDGPYADRGAVDQIIQGMGGLMSVTGEPGGVPMRAGIAVSDVAAGHQLAIGILIALHERERTGRGQWVRVSLIEAMIAFLDFQAARWTIDGVVPVSEGNHHPTVCPMGTYAAADGHLNVAALNGRHWKALCAALGDPGMADDPRFATGEARYAHRSILNPLIDSKLRTRTRAEWIQILNDVGVPCGGVLSIDEVFGDPQVRHLDVLAEVEHPVRGRVKVLRNSITMSASRRIDPRPSPAMGDGDIDGALARLGVG